MRQLKRIMVDPQVMGGKPCIRNLRVTVGTIVGLIGAGRTTEEVLDAYPYSHRGAPPIQGGDRKEGLRLR